MTKNYWCALVKKVTNEVIYEIGRVLERGGMGHAQCLCGASLI
jgi:hypothetical protein